MYEIPRCSTRNEMTTPKSCHDARTLIEYSSELIFPHLHYCCLCRIFLTLVLPFLRYSASVGNPQLVTKWPVSRVVYSCTVPFISWLYPVELDLIATETLAIPSQTSINNTQQHTKL